ncbi:MAG: hypothetical protein K8T91_18060 [Planctomycetes bacterium]|nr:hypothetical protein [Planctomycetota bacterium]
MCAYDTTLFAVMQPPVGSAKKVAPRMQRRAARLDTLFPPMSRGALAVIIALSAVFLATSLHRLNDTDLWGHLSYGRWMVEHRALVTADPLGVADGGGRFVNIPWLAQVSGYLWYQATGPGGLQLAHAALMTLATGVLIAAVRYRGVSLAGAAAAGVAFYVLALPIVGTVRPQLFGLLGMSLTLLAWSLTARGRRHPLFWFPLVMVLWANLHGSFLMGLAVLAAAAVGQIWDVGRRCGSIPAAWRAPSVRRLRMLLMLSAAATLLNPAGPALWWNALLFGQSANLADISEWGPTTLRSLTGVLLFGSLAVTALLLRQSHRPVRAAEVLLVLALAAATLLAIRMLCWWAIVWVYLAAPHVAAVIKRWRTGGGDCPNFCGAKMGLSPSSSAHDPPTAMRTMIAMALVFLVLVWAPPTHELISGQRRSEALVAAGDTPQFVAEEIQARGLTGRVFAPIQWADYLAWHTNNAIRPLVYSHVHLFSPATWHDYQAIASDSPDLEQIVDRHGLRYFVLPRPMAAVLGDSLGRNKRFRTIYQDQQAVLVEVKPAAKPAL